MSTTSQRNSCLKGTLSHWQVEKLAVYKFPYINLSFHKFFTHLIIKNHMIKAIKEGDTTFKSFPYLIVEICFWITPLLILEYMGRCLSRTSHRNMMVLRSCLVTSISNGLNLISYENYFLGYIIWSQRCHPWRKGLIQFEWKANWLYYSIKMVASFELYVDVAN